MSRVAPSGLGKRLRRMSERLSPLIIENDNTKNPFFNIMPRKVSEAETREEGKALLENFIAEEIDRDTEIDSPDEIVEKLNICTPKGYANPAWAKAGQDLRRFADEFMRSKERKKVKQRAKRLANEQDVEHVTKGQFRDLLSEFLRDGMTRDHIMILFFFCADVTISLLKKRMSGCIDLCRQFIEWSVEFIMEKVCAWVTDNGGWAAVFNSSMVLIVKAVALIGLGVMGYFGYKKLTRLFTDKG